MPPTDLVGMILGKDCQRSPRCAQAMEGNLLVARQPSPDGHLRSIADLGQVAVATTAGDRCPAPVRAGGRMSASPIVGVDPGRYGTRRRRGRRGPERPARPPSSPPGRPSRPRAARGGGRPRARPRRGRRASGRRQRGRSGVRVPLPSSVLLGAGIAWVVRPLDPKTPKRRYAAETEC